ncbi:MAG TPA: PAS domain S-box protein [candidate division Zixibacteria bacterium]|nr:PAS domain S-box protein [candidate division Zixibacteria bacterium]
MIAIYFVYGLAFFTLGFAVALESKRKSDLPLGSQLIWLAAFGLVHAAVEWADMLILTVPGEPYYSFLNAARTLLLPVSTILLIRFGAGLIYEAGPLPRWFLYLPLIFTVPVAILVGYAIISATADPILATDVWSRYLLYFSGCLLASYGFLRQRKLLIGANLAEARNLMLGAAIVFAINAVIAGLIVPRASYGLAPWLNYESVMDATGVPVQIWRMISAIAVTLFVIRALNVFEAEREQRLAKLQAKRQEAEATLRESEERFRTVFEMAPIGMDIVSPKGQPIQANLALQQMLGYTADELRSMVYTDYTHSDDVEPSQTLVREVAEGKREHFRLEKRYISKDGSLIWGHVAVSGVRDPAGQLLYFIAMVEDITERKRIEETLHLERERTQADRLQTQIEAREAADNWANSLVDISRLIANMDSVDDILLHIVSQAQQLLESDMVSIGLLDETGTALELKCQAIGDRAFILDWPVVVENEMLLEMLRALRTYRYPEEIDGPLADWYCPTVAERIRTAAVVPLHFDGRIVGGLWAGRISEVPFESTHVLELESLADQAVIALQHALMAARLQSLAVIEERARIAREMHDGLAQVLGYLSLQVQTLEVLTRQGDTDGVLAELEKTRENIKIAHADVRENILSLRTTLAGESGIVPAIQEYVSEFGVQSGCETDVTNNVEGVPNISPLAEVQLVRIVQEALSNVRKHAQASQVSVNLSHRNGDLFVSIVDDGNGFDSSTEDRQFGLQTMRERAESVDGSLTVSSMPGKGTEICLLLPLIPESRVKKRII